MYNFVKRKKYAYLNHEQIAFAENRSVLNLPLNDISSIVVFDINGDGQSDVLRFDPLGTGLNYVYRKSAGRQNNSNYSYPDAASLRNPISMTIFSPEFDTPDLNGDGLPDYFSFAKTNRNLKYWLINRGNGTFTQRIANPGDGNIKFLQNTSNFDFIEFNGDGKADLFRYDTISGFNTLSANRTGTDTVDFLNIGLFYPFQAEDLIGSITILPDNYSINSLYDFFIFDLKTGRNSFYSSSYVPNDVVKVIRNGNNSSILINYGTILDTSIYKSTRIENLYPTAELIHDMQVTKSVSMSNGVGGLSTLEYKYENISFDLTGRGLRGFDIVSTLDVDKGIKTVKYAKRDSLGFFFTADPIFKTETYLHPSGILIDRTLEDHEVVKQLDRYKRPIGSYFTFKKSTKRYSYDLKGSLIDSVYYRQQVDSMGNVLYTVIDYGAGDVDSTINLYKDDFSKWHLGRLVESKVFRKALGKKEVIRTVFYEYDINSGLLQKETVEPTAGGNLTTSKSYEYDIFGNIIKSHVTALNNGFNETRTTTTRFDSKGRFPLEVSNPIGHKNIRSYDEPTGLVLSSTDENSLTTRYIYDDFGRLIREDSPDGNWLKYDYRKCGGQVACPTNAIHVVFKQSSLAPTEITYLDDLDRVIRNEDIGFDGKSILVDNHYSKLFYLDKTSDPYFKGETPVFSQYFYDAAGRTVESKLPGNRSNYISYNKLSTEYTNPNRQIKTVLKNARGQVISVTDNLRSSLVYSYDAAGNLTEIRDPNGNTTKYEYDLRNRKIKTIDPDLGVLLFEYNGFDELVAQTSNRGLVTKTEFDKLGRIVRRIEQEGVTTFNYDIGNKSIGKISRIIGPDGYSISFQYDSLGRPLSQTRIFSNKKFVTEINYDSKGRLGVLKYPSGFVIKHHYNSFGFLSEIRNFNNNYLIWKADQITARGQLSSQTLGNGVQTSNFWNSVTGLLDSTVSKNGAHLIQSFSYRFDPVFNLLTRVNNKYNRREEFSYDQLNRLIKTKLDGADSVILNYDILGNIVFKSDVGQYEYGQVNNGPHRVIKITPTVNVCIPTSEIVTEYTSYDKVSRITKNTGEALRISYDPEGNRSLISLSSGSKLIKQKFYAGQFMDQEVLGDTIRNINYIFAYGEVVAQLNEDNLGKRQLNFWHKDHLGSITSITDSIGNLFQELAYDPWGKRRNADWTTIVGPDTSRYILERGFTTHEHYDLFEVVNMNGRIYDAILGRFLSADPNVDDITDLQSLNRYSYVNNNPLSYTDPSGYFKKFFKGVKKIGRIAKFAVSPVSILVDKKAQAWLKNNWKQIAVTAVAIGVSAALGPGAGIYLASAASGFASGFTGAMLYGASLKDALKAGIKSAAIGLATAGISHGAGEIAGNLGNAGLGSTGAAAIKALGNGLVQGGVNKIQGGSFAQGFWSGSVSSLGGQISSRMPSVEFKLISNAIVGGTIAEISGGKFANGAIASSYTMMFQMAASDITSERDARVIRKMQYEKMFNDKINEIDAGLKTKTIPLYASDDIEKEWDYKDGAETNEVGRKSLIFGPFSGWHLDRKFEQLKVRVNKKMEQMWRE
jgi:RHS repeat-associated protein